MVSARQTEGLRQIKSDARMTSGSSQQPGGPKNRHQEQRRSSSGDHDLLLFPHGRILSCERPYLGVASLRSPREARKTYHCVIK